MSTSEFVYEAGQSFRAESGLGGPP